MSTGSKLVSFLLSKPAPNSIWGTEQLPKSPMLADEAVEVAAAAEEERVAEAASVAAADAELTAVTVTVT